MTTQTTIIDQMKKFFKNCLDFMVVLKNLGIIKKRTAIKKIVGIN
tara:strand:+ start:214 stop:348 length:135 start_codon:yes stop_codon:yes gene_type:complete